MVCCLDCGLPGLDSGFFLEFLNRNVKKCFVSLASSALKLFLRGSPLEGFQVIRGAADGLVV